MKVLLVLVALVALTGCDRRPAPTPGIPTTAVTYRTEVSVDCTEDMPCWVCSSNDSRCSSRSF